MSIFIYFLIFAVRQAARRFGFKLVEDDEEWHLYWTDSSVTLDRVLDMRRYQVCVLDFLFQSLQTFLHLENQSLSRYE